MTAEPVRLRTDATLREATGLLALADVRHLPVVDGDRVVGMVSERDVLGVLLPDNAGSPTLDSPSVREVMSEELIAVHPDAPLAEVVAKLLEHRVGAVLVLEDDRLHGIVSYIDVLEALKPFAADEP
ncbi:MAG: CBS domain-containing protein [Myxococcota bacterium]